MRERAAPQATEAALGALRARLGSERVLTGADELASHGRDEGWHPPAPPDAVVRPRDTEEAAAVVAACAQHGVPVIPFGAAARSRGTQPRCMAACRSTCAP